MNRAGALVLLYAAGAIIAEAAAFALYWAVR